MNNYPDAPAKRNTLREGEAYQTFVRQILNRWGFTLWHHESKGLQYSIGENPQGFEIKLDTRCFSHDPTKNPTNRLSIEVAEKTRRQNPEWIPSGILRNDNAWIYVQGNYAITFIFAKNWLLRFFRERERRLRR